jgi:hypothetical protein
VWAAFFKIAPVDVDVIGRAFRSAGQQGTRVGKHHRVIVHIDHPAVSRHLLCDLMGVARCGDTGADVEELPHPDLTGEVTHHPAKESPVRPG